MNRDIIMRNLLSESCINTTLGSNSVASSRKQFGDTGSVEASFRKTEGGSQTGTSSTDNDGIILVVLFQVSIDGIVK